jgi:hypothetical protein
VYKNYKKKQIIFLETVVILTLINVSETWERKKSDTNHSLSEFRLEVAQDAVYRTYGTVTGL